jgi:hypothetical protein
LERSQSGYGVISEKSRKSTVKGGSASSASAKAISGHSTQISLWRAIKRRIPKGFRRWWGLQGFRRWWGLRRWTNSSLWPRQHGPQHLDLGAGEFLLRPQDRHAQLVHIVPKRVVYTCLFGKYERLNEQTIAKKSDIPFVCFTDQTYLASKTWSIRNVRLLGIDSTRESRRLKILPHIFLPEFDESLYIDNSVILKMAPNAIFETYLQSDAPNFVCFRHPERDCIYEEAEEIIRRDIDLEVKVREQMDHYRAHGYPAHAGLIASTFILRRHQEIDVKATCELWFSHVLRYSKRDQLSFNYNAWRTGLAFTALNLDLESNDIFDWPEKTDRLPHDFDENIYLWLNPDVAKARLDPRQHYVLHGRKEGRSYRYHAPIELNRLANKFKTDKGNMYYNRRFYSRVYNHYLSHLRSDKFSLIEIGLLRHDVQASLHKGPLDNAPSLFMWSEYFPHAQIHGVDIQDFSPVERDRITFTQADQSDRSALTRVIKRCHYPVRVIIDDGSHASRHQQVSLACLFPHLASGGFYFIEDLHYQPRHMENPQAIKTRDLLRKIVAGERPHSAFVRKEEMDYLVDNIADIQFFDSMDSTGGPIGVDALALIRKK